MHLAHVIWLLLLDLMKLKLNLFTYLLWNNTHQNQTNTMMNKITFFPSNLL